MSAHSCSLFKSQRWKWNQLNATADHTADWFYHCGYGMLVNCWHDWTGLSSVLLFVFMPCDWNKVHFTDSCWLFVFYTHVTTIVIPRSPVSAEFICMPAYSQCASTTSRGTVSSGKLTARRVREAVSSSSSSSLSRSTALWPMAAHRRHFLFHTSGDVTWKHIQKE